MSEAYWQAKIWGLLHDPVLKALHNNTGRGDNSFWQQLEVMQSWVENNYNPEESGHEILKHIHLAVDIASASDRAGISSIVESLNYAPVENFQKGSEISHLLSGEKQQWKIKPHSEVLLEGESDLNSKEQKLLEAILEALKTDIKGLFWWLWRCLPAATCKKFNDASLMLMPAETCLPDSSIWSHGSVTASLAGALAGYDLTMADIESWPSGKELSHPYLAVFSFTPVQEMIKASRKMRDFWAGSWLLHYLSAKVCWKLAQQYGPDSLLYPSLYQQPLIDHWLLEKYPDFKDWIHKPEEDSLLTAGFPNVLVLVLPKDKVEAAMQTAKQTLLNEWRDISKLVFADLQTNRHWMPKLQLESSTWQGWLQSQWQFYWTALPVGKEGEELKNAAIPKDREGEFISWLNAQNQAYNLGGKQKLFQEAELDFLREAYQQRWEKQGRRFSANVGYWWGNIFDETRCALASVKNARNWEIPTAFGPRSTISGIGPVVNPGKDGKDWITEGETKKLWEQHVGLFDGREQLNATETVKRGLHKILPELLKLPQDKIAASYPDLTSGVGGYLKNSDIRHLENFHQAFQSVKKILADKEAFLNNNPEKWGIPWIDYHENPLFKKSHPRFLNPGWLLEDMEISEELKNEYPQKITQILNQYYPSNNPASWYVLAAGDGDSMSDWLKGKNLQNYSDYIPSELSVSLESFQKFLEEKKRMGPSTHSALSRALLDFSNQLVPYLTQQRYAGRLIYAGGDDVLAYTNLWEWDNWLWDIRQCFQGKKDPKGEFKNSGDYWQYDFNGTLPQGLAERPLFTMGKKATISFGIVIVHHSVPLAIALENLWLAEEEAKEHEYHNSCRCKDQKACLSKKDAVQVRVLYSNGNTLKSTAKFDVFHEWQKLIAGEELDSAIFEQAASLWNQHPAPIIEAILPWTRAFCDRRDQFQGDEPEANKDFQQALSEFLKALWHTTADKSRDAEVQNWLKLAAFVKRNRKIDLGGGC